MNPGPGSWSSRILTAVALLLVVAYGARLVWETLRPLLGPLLILGIVVAIFGLLIRRHRRW